MTDRELLQKMIDRIGKEPRAVKFDDDNNLVELNLAGLDLEDIPTEFYSFSCLQILVLGDPTGSKRWSGRWVTASKALTLPSGSV